jgi:hypothetical protein
MAKSAWVVVFVAFALVGLATSATLDAQAVEQLLNGNVLPVDPISAPSNYSMKLVVHDPEFFEAEYENQPALELNYNVMTVPNLVSLDHLSSISSVRCEPSALEIEFYGSEQAIDWQDKLVVGGLKWECIIDAEEETYQAFYRLVHEVIRLDEKRVRLVTEEKDFTDCFIEADIRFLVAPAKESNETEPADTLEKRGVQAVRRQVSWNVNYPNTRAHTLLRSGSNFAITCRSCFFSSNVGVEFDLGVRRPSLRRPIPGVSRFMVRAFGNARLNIALEASARVRASSSRTVSLVPSIRLPTISFSIGPVPVTISPRASMSATGSVNFQARASATIRAVGTTSINFGVRYTDSSRRFETFRTFNRPSFSITGPTVTATATGNARVWIAPQLTLLLWNSVPFVVETRPYIGIGAQAGSASRCTGRRVSYNSFYGVDATVRLDPIRVLRRTFNFGGRLPWSWRGTLIGQRDLTCARCRGCLGRKKRDVESAFELLDVTADQSAMWMTTDWSPCSSTCGSGTEMRDVYCANDDGAQIQDSACNSATRPLGARVCNSYTDCDVHTVCAALNECDACTSQAPSCFWCASTNKCSYANQTESCARPVEDTCAELEPTLKLQSPRDTQTFAPNQNNDPVVVNIRWTGGPALADEGEVQLLFAFVPNTTVWYTGAGLPSDSVPNTGSFDWKVPRGFKVQGLRVGVFSLDFEDNFAAATISLNGGQAENEKGITPIYSTWGECSMECGYGYMTREKRCFDFQMNEVSGASVCNDAMFLEPTIFGCNDFPCEDFPIQISSPAFADRVTTGEMVKLEWSGGSVDSGVVLEYRHAIHPDSTVHDVSEEEIFEEDALTWSEWYPLLPPFFQGDKSMVPNSGEYDWFVPEDLRGNWVYYQIRVTSDRSPSNSHVSPTFIVSRAVSLRVELTQDHIKSSQIAVTLNGMLGSSEAFVIDTAELNKKRFIELVDYEDVGDILSVSLDLFEESDRGDKLDSALRIVQVNALEQDVTVAFKSSIAHQERFNCETFDGDCASCTTLDVSCGWCPSTASCMVNNNLTGPIQCPSALIMTEDFCVTGVTETSFAVNGAVLNVVCLALATVVALLF